MSRQPRLRRALRMAAAITLLSAPLAACGGGGSSDPASGTLVSVIPSFPGIVPLLVDSLDVDAKHGIDLEVKPTGKSGAVPLASLLSRDADFALVSRQTVFDAATEQKDLVIVAPVYPWSNITVVRKDVIADKGLDAEASPQDRIKALKGLTIASAPTGSGNDLLLRGALSSAGLNPDKDVKIIGLGEPAAIVAGLKQGQFDAASYSVGALENNIAAGDADLWLSVGQGDMGELAPEDDSSVVVVTRRDVVEKNPDLVAATYDTLVDVQKQIAEDPQKVGAALHEKWMSDMDSKVFELAWGQVSPNFFPSGTFTKDQFERAKKEMSKKGDLKYEELVYARAQE